MNQKPSLIKGNILKSFLQSKKGQYSLFSLLTLSVLLISGLYTFSLLKQNNIDTALAGLNCPANFTLVNGNCQYNATPNTSLSCPQGGTVNGTNCTYNAVQGSGQYSCPQGGALNGQQCSYNATPQAIGGTCPQGGVIVDSSPGSNIYTIFSQYINGPFGGAINIQGSQACLVDRGQTFSSDPCVGYNNSSVNGFAWVAVSNRFCYSSPFPSSASFTCDKGGILGTDNNCYAYSSGAPYSNTWCPSGWSNYNTNVAFAGCIKSPSQTPSNQVTQTCPSGGSAVGSICYYNATLSPGAYSCPLGGSLSGTTCSYPATSTTSSYFCPNGGNVSGTVCLANSGTTYTPEPGQITGLTCTPSSVVASGTVNCSGQATGAPSGVPYAGNITVTIDNGGGSITTTINPDGTFTASSVPVGTTTGTKAATTNLGGTTSITVTAASITVDPDLASGPGSLSNSTDCTSAKNVTIGTVYTCSFPINGTGPFVLPAGGIQARTNQSANNSTPVNTCTIAASVLTCTGITTVGTPSTLIAGTGNVQLGKGTTPATWNTKGVVTLVAATSPLTTTDIPSLTVTCGVGGTPGTVRVNTTTTCTFTLPTNKTLPNNFKLGIGNATPAGTCTVGTGINSSLVTCINVPTGTLLGTQPINGQIGTETITPTGETVNVIDSLCSTTNPCALFETALTYSPTQALAKRYGASGSTNSDNLILTLKDTRLEQSGFTTTCSIKYKFRTDTSYRTLTTNSTYNNTTGCTGNLLKANQLLFNVDFEITAITTNTTTNTTKNYLIYSNYDFKAGSIGVTSIGGSGL